MSSGPSDEQSIRNDFKIIVIGSSGAGKTSYINKWTKNVFSGRNDPPFGFKVFENEGYLYRIQLWDWAWQDKNSTVTKIFAKDSNGCIIVSDSTKPGSLQE